MLVVCAGVLVVRAATAQEECPVAELGQACDAGTSGTCIQATCTQTVDGSTTSRSCGACVPLPPNACEDAGSCGDGGQCVTLGAGGGGGAAGGGSSSMIAYGFGVCQYPNDAETDDGPVRGLGGDDAAVTMGTGAASGSEHGDSSAPNADVGGDASPGGPAAAAGGSGCTASGSAAESSGASALALVVAAASLVRRRRRSPVTR